MAACSDFAAPLFEAVEYEQRDWESIFTEKVSQWNGAPTIELEERWQQLVAGVTFFHRESLNSADLYSSDGDYTGRPYPGAQSKHRARLCQGRRTGK